MWTTPSLSIPTQSYPLLHHPKPHDSGSYLKLCFRRQRMWGSPLSLWLQGERRSCAWPPWHMVTTAGRSGNQALHHTCTETPRRDRGTSLPLLMWSSRHFGWGPPVPASTRVLTPREAFSLPVGSVRGTLPHQVEWSPR